MRLINNVIRKLGRENYTIDKNIDIRSLLIIILEKFCQVLRGYRIKPFLKSSDGLIFVGKHVKLKHKHLISTKRVSRGFC